uniref:Ig-like domain-containing protein n=1 Tax=Latimeria chalumnae TaxID=7897 RepID=H3A6C1_LATCH
THTHGWSMKVHHEVYGVKGQPVTLPCSITHPYKHYGGPIAVLWKRKDRRTGTTVFRCVNHNITNTCRATINEGDRYKLLGSSVRHNNLSLVISNLSLSDSDRYFCRVDFTAEDHGKFETPTGTQLHVTAQPAILDITVHLINHTSYKAICVAEGEPLPTVAWHAPPHRQLPFTNMSDGRFFLPLTSGPAGKHQVTVELQQLAEDGKYTCVASNKYGRDERAVFFYRGKREVRFFSINLLWVVLGIKFGVFLLILGVMAFYSKKGK